MHRFVVKEPNHKIQKTLKIIALLISINNKQKEWLAI